ncbi:YlbG family protein [Liquorilactobacillus sicerae]|uniref:YlbG family protein n=1 Tax=Liquorilactobacillus sicerae TaxID=1416943 RepID=UPI002480CBCD|nr:YlbG family protein [Liquorilactobacillus sicerae]
MDFEIKQREGLIVFLYHLKNSRQLRKYGTIHYVSKKMKYVVLYVDQTDEKEVFSKLQSLKFVRKVQRSLRKDLKTDFGDEVGVLYKLTDEDREKYRTGRK